MDDRSHLRRVGERRNDSAATLRLFLRLALDRVPVDQRQAKPGVVGRQPGSTVPLPGINRAPAPAAENFRRKRDRACSLFVAIHRETKSLRSWKEGDGAHSIRNRVTRCRATVFSPFAPERRERTGRRSAIAAGGVELEDEPSWFKQRAVGCT